MSDVYLVYYEDRKRPERAFDNVGDAKALAETMARADFEYMVKSDRYKVGADMISKWETSKDSRVLTYSYTDSSRVTLTGEWIRALGWLTVETLNIFQHQERDT